MRCRILHETKGRMRVRLLKYRVTCSEADQLETYLLTVPEIRRAVVNERTGDAVITHSGDREAVIRALAEYDPETCTAEVTDRTGRELRRTYEDRFFWLIARRYAVKLLLPAPVRHLSLICKSWRFFREAFRCLGRKKLEVPVLDATTIAVSLLRQDYDTAGTIMFMLDAGGLLEEWTHKKSVDDLAKRMSLNVDKVWLKSGGSEVLVPVKEVREGDVILVRTGNVIPLDGVVEDGEAAVNQASMTGESLPVPKSPGSYVYAGTVMEEGEIAVRVKNAMGGGRYDRIIQMIEDSEKLKSETESRAFHLADSMVPVSLGGTALTWFLTGNVTKALSILMVDFSCALKLTMPVSVLSGIRECSEHQISVKGGKFLEAVSEAKTVIFDKTGTLTYATPRVKKVVTFGGRDADEMLRLAACLEEHFPHSIANAVVEEAKRKGLVHEEKHSKVDYVVAHGIASTINGQKVCIGSHHFIFEDEKCTVPEEEKARFRRLPRNCSLLYLALDDELAAVLCIEDPLRKEAKQVMRQLHAAGFEKLVMMTGDSYRTAESVAKELGIDEFHAEVLPEDKAAFVRREHELGHKVIMIGDGINDSPALSEADAGIAISAGAAIAREIADITISADDLTELVTLKRISDALMDRIHGNYVRIMTFNSGLIALGLLGILAPGTAAFLHNASTLAFGLESMTDLL